MMLKFLTMMPHGDEVFNPKDNDTKELKNIMEIIGTSAEDLDEFIVISPHNIRIMDHISVIISEHVSNGKDYITDRKLADLIYAEAKKRNLSIVEVNYGALEGDASRIPLDWGTSIPLEFIKNVKRIVLISPARKIERAALIKFGEIIADISENYNKEIGIIVSADNAHAHRKDGPYGFSKFAKVIPEQQNS